MDNDPPVGRLSRKSSASPASFSSMVASGVPFFDARGLRACARRETGNLITLVVLSLESAFDMIHLQCWGLGPARKFALPSGSLFVYTNNHAEARKNCIQKIK